MSILNDTLKSLDERNQSEDFGLPPTVQVASRPLWPKMLIGLIVLGLIGWLVFSALVDSYDSSELVVADRAKGTEQNDTPSTKTNLSREPTSLTQSANESAEVQSENGDSVLLEGMQSTPLSEQDMANQEVPSDVAELVFNSVDETVADDEAEYRQQTQENNTSNSRHNTESQVVESAVSNSASKVATLQAQTIESERARSVEEASTVSMPSKKQQQTTSKTSDGIKEASSGSIISRKPAVEVAPKSPQQQSSAHLEAGLKAYNFGMFEDAQKNFTLALSTYPQNIEARKQLAGLYFGQNNNLQALQVLSEGVVLSPESLVWRELMAKILVQENRFEEALNLMPESLDAKALAEKRIDYLILKGTSAQTINKPAQAISAFSAMTSLQPNNAKWWLALGVNYDALEDKRLAISSYSRALAIGGLSSTSSQYASSRLNDLQEQP